MKECSKKVFRMASIILMSVAMMCILIACGKEKPANVKRTETSQGTVADNTDSPQGADVSEDKVSTEPDRKSEAKILIAYFSWSGNSKSEAELI